MSRRRMSRISRILLWTMFWTPNMLYRISGASNNTLIYSKGISLYHLLLAQIQRNRLFPNGIDKIGFGTRNKTIYGRCRQDLQTNWNAIIAMCDYSPLYTFRVFLRRLLLL